MLLYAATLKQNGNKAFVKQPKFTVLEIGRGVTEILVNAQETWSS